MKNTNKYIAIVSISLVDERFAEIFAPKLNELVEKGDIAGWG